MILDTSFMIDIMDGDPDALRKLKEIDSKSTPKITTSTSIFELNVGAELSVRKEDEKQKIRYAMEGLTIIQFDATSAERGGEIHGKLLKQGQGINAVDSMIAGIASARGETILTRNVKHFSKVQGLKIETY